MTHPARVPCRPAATFHLWVGLAGALLSGCSSSSQFSVDAVRRADAHLAPHLSYRLVLSAAADAAALSPLAEQRLLRDIRTALSSRGLFEAPAGVTPALEVEIDFGLEGPVQRELTYTEPVYVTAPSAPRTSGRAGAGDFSPAGLPRRLGDRQVTKIVSLFPKFLRLTARETSDEAGEGRTPLWSVVVCNEDQSDDLARYTRLMAAAAMDYIDVHASAGEQVVLSYADGRVQFIEQGI